MGTLEEIDVKGYLNAGGDRYVSKKGGYVYFDNLFWTFVHYEWDKLSKIPKELFSDKNCAAYLVAICNKYDYHTSSFRKAMAAIRGWLIVHGIALWDDHAHWPLVGEVNIKYQDHIRKKQVFSRIGWGSDICGSGGSELLAIHQA